MLLRSKKAFPNPPLNSEYMGRRRHPTSVQTSSRRRPEIALKVPAPCECSAPDRPRREAAALVFNLQAAPFYPFYLRELGAVAASLAAEISATPVRNEAEIEAALTALEREPGSGLIVPPHPFINIHRGLIIRWRNGTGSLRSMAFGSRSRKAH
jgi:hypothetical protein